MTTLTHDFVLRHYTALVEMLHGTTKLDKFLKNLRDYARTQRDPNTPEGEPDKTQLKIIGDGFEVFGEAFIKLCGRSDNRIYIKDFYRPSEQSDNGVDGVGTDSKTGQVVFVQFKCYKPTEFLTGVGSHLDSFQAECMHMMMDEHKFPSGIKLWPRMVVITSAADIHPYTKEQKYRDRVECFPHGDLKRLVDNGTFWDDFRGLVG